MGTGRSRRVCEGLERLIHLSGRTVRVSVDPALQSRRGPIDSRANIDRIIEPHRLAAGDLVGAEPR